MPFWRRRRPLHERLAEEGGLRFEAEPPPHDVRPRFGEVAIHGMHRPREFDAVVTVDAAGPAGPQLSFVVLPDDSVLVESDEDIADDDIGLFTAALEGSVTPPYRCIAVRRGERRWAAAANGITVARLEHDLGGDSASLSVHDGARTLAVDGAPAFGSAPELEELAGDLDDYVVEAGRLDGDLWEVRVTPL
jgi:hypothetical protein